MGLKEFEFGIVIIETFIASELAVEVAIRTIPKSNSLRPTFAYFPREIGLGTVKFALVLVIAGKGVQHMCMPCGLRPPGHAHAGFSRRLASPSLSPLSDTYFSQVAKAFLPSVLAL